MKRPSPQGLGQFVASGLAFLAADPERFDRFLALTGLNVSQLRTAVTARTFAESLLDYLCSDESLLLAYAADSGDKPADIEAMRQSLAPAPFVG